MKTERFDITFWGVRGSIPIARSDFMKYGGATPCIEIQAGEHELIFDAGSGVHQLGRKLSNQGKAVVAHVFFSHVHWDHIHGIPFFSPAFETGNMIHFYGEKRKDLSIRDQLAGMMKEPYWPVGLGTMKAEIIFHTISVNETIILAPGLTVQTMRGNHPGETLLYRVTYGERSVCYISDYEHQDKTDPELVEFVRGTDVLLYDATYTDEEYYGLNGKPPKKGWGHSTWQEGCKLAKLAEAKQLILFHHEINRTDQDLEVIEKEAREHFPNTYAARVGMRIKL